MTLHDDDMNRILEQLTRNDYELDQLNVKAERMNSFQQDGLMTEWTADDDLLENMFSLEQSSLSFLGDDLHMPELGDLPAAEAEPVSSSSSDSGLSSDHAEFDFEQELCPYLIQGVPGGLGSPSPAGPPSPAEPPSPAHTQDVMTADSESSDSCSSLDLLHFEQNVVPSFINTDTFQSPGKNRKRRLSQTPEAAVQPKVQKPVVQATPVVRPQLVVQAQPQKPVKLTNLQLLGPQTKVYSKPVESVAPQRRVIRVAPMAAGGNPRSILLPVTIKDMKDLKSIKIVNAAELHSHSPSLQRAAATLLHHSRRQAAAHSDNAEESGSECSESPEPVPNASGEYPRLVLSAEERRLLAKEGVRLPARLPLTKNEERELKRIRRKIRNKISAQDSRKRKKEYVDGLEDRVKQCTSENQTLIRRIKILQSQNHTLTAQLKRLQKVVRGVSGPPGRAPSAAPPATCLMVLLLSVALVALPSLRDSHSSHSSAAAAARQARPATPPALTRALLSANKMMLDETVIDEGEFSLDEPLSLEEAEVRHVEHDYPRPSLSRYVDLPPDDFLPHPHKTRLKDNFPLEAKMDPLPVEFPSRGALAEVLLSTGAKLGRLWDALLPPRGASPPEEARNCSDVRGFVVEAAEV